MNVRMKGRLTNWDEAKGFGFLEPCLGGPAVFIHIKALQQASRRPVIGDLIIFSHGRDKNGRICAVDASLSADTLVTGVVGRNNKQVKEKPNGTGSTKPVTGVSVSLICLSFGALLTGLFLKGLLPLGIIYLYLVMSLLTFLAYGWDKWAAIKGRWRTRESTLHLLALLCGWPGALLAQYSLSHKSVKQAFRRLYLVTVILNLGLLGYGIHSGLVL